MVSVIVPVYNVKTYLKKCIDSILSQTYKDLELILVDDGSTDGCAQICDDYLCIDERVKVIHKKNGGQGSARNCALDIAKGDYIMFVDSDDYINNDMIDYMLESLERTESDIAFCGFITHSGMRIVNSTTENKEILMNGAEEILLHYFTTNYVSGAPCGKLFRKHLFDNIRFPEGVAREDVYIAHHIFGNCKKGVHVGRDFYNYIIREGSSEHQEFSPKFLISIKIADERYDYIKNNFPNLADIANISVYGARLSAIKKITRSGAVKSHKSTYLELKKYIKDHAAPTKEFKKTRNLILYFPIIYKIKLNFSHKWRKKIKKIALKIKGGNRL